MSCRSEITHEGFTRRCQLKAKHKGFHAWGFKWGTVTIRIGGKNK